MTNDPVTRWYKSRKYAQVNGARVRPVPNPFLKTEPLSIQKGQAQSFCLVAEDGSKSILKKSLKGKDLDRNYLESVTSVLPRVQGFRAGTQRQILSSDKLAKVSRCYYSVDLAAFIQDTILMPQIDGIDWSGLADDVREGRVQLPRACRIALCQNLIALVVLLEKYNICHRDLSSGNLLIHIISCMIYLIDFESAYHPTLRMPEVTTCGTVGYAPPFAWRAGVLDPKQSWCPYADRYALSVLVVEFLVLDKGWPLTAEGGMFEQDELRARSGPGLDRTKRALKAKWPSMAGLFERAISSENFQTCPSPQQWQQAFESISERPPSLAQLESIDADYFKRMLSRNRRPAPLWPAPDLSEIPAPQLQLPKVVSQAVTLPPNPWN
jgi:serine/threonine protein kinase